MFVGEGLKAADYEMLKAILLLDAVLNLQTGWVEQTGTFAAQICSLSPL